MDKQVRLPRQGEGDFPVHPLNTGSTHVSGVLQYKNHTEYDDRAQEKV